MLTIMPSCASSATALKRGAAASFKGSNTTLVAVATNAKLTKVTATKVAQLAQVGLTRVIWPAHTMVDGDMVFCLSPVTATAGADVIALGIAAAEAVSEAILRGVRAARKLGGVPGLAD